MTTSERLDLSHDTTLWPQYYQCVVTGIPLDMAPPALVDYLMPREDSEVVKALVAAGKRIVLHQLYTYKEPLDTKFAYFAFFLQTQPGGKDDEVTRKVTHHLVRCWIEEDLRMQLTSGGMDVRPAQPAECYHSEPFLKAFRSRCSLHTPKVTADPRKLETFVLARTTFTPAEENAEFNPTWAKAGEPYESSADAPAEAPQWTSPVGTFSVSGLSAKEVLWLKKNCDGFPPLLITDGDLGTAHVDGEALIKYFKEHLSPMIEVVE